MKKLYEAWQDEDEGGISFAQIEAIEREKSQGMISENAQLLHRVEADTWEEAMTVHYQKMDWSPYKSMGEAVECPNDCGSAFRPEGSGKCPDCGKIC